MAANKIPLVELPTNFDDGASMSKVACQVSEALQSTGFLLVRSQDLSIELQLGAIRATEEILNDEDNPGTIRHPVDPKRYIMLENADSIGTLKASDEQLMVLREYWMSMENVKHQVLKCISLGLGLPLDVFSKAHSGNNSSLRLLHYPVSTRELSEQACGENDEDVPLLIRCKAHSDYGSVTLLSTDGVGGLQAMINGAWIDVPYVEGALVVNIGSLMSDWTNGKLLSTLHRVVSDTRSAAPRTSIAFFADPDSDTSLSLGSQFSGTWVTVAEYIQYRSGGDGRGRVGVAFTGDESNRAGGGARHTKE